ncbi:mitochondrial sodium/calcium exchanger protein-like isoform X2 [Dermacentor variabilis]|uniref:mitochondrial sodium/calcium exchanger protein-like isoform X2 n=1 Tax=Dermacentor variabilis TaxID=34621 RepID=UPI003F5B541F
MCLGGGRASVAAAEAAATNARESARMEAVPFSRESSGNASSDGLDAALLAVVVTAAADCVGRVPPCESVYAPCDRVHHLNASLQCDFVSSNEECHSDEQYLAYTTFVYCAFGSGQTVPGLVVLALGLLIMFVGLGITADDFLTPSLIVISDSLHLSQNIAGVTFLAFGNGAPDILSSLAGIQQARPELVIGELFGAGIFVTCVVAGSVYLTQDFNVMERPFLRDVIFYISATFWAFYLFYTQRITIAHSIGFIMLYILFILVVVFGRLVYQRMSKADQEKTPVAKAGVVAEAPKGLLQKLREGLFPAREVTGNVSGDQQKKCAMFDKCAPEEYDGVILRHGELAPPLPLPSPPPFLGLDPLTHGTLTSIPVPAGPESVAELTVPTPKPQSQPPPEPQPESQTQLSPLREFWLHIRPIDMEEWPSKPWLARIIEIIKAPIYFILTVTTPVVDYENDKHNWCRLLNSLHCVLSPLFITLVATGGDDMVGGVPVIVIVALAFACVAGTVFATSTYEDPPGYHWVFGYVGFLVAVAWIYLLANEVLSLLKTFGIVIGLSDAFLGMTVLAWGNSIGDYISNLSVARQGYPRMAISACYGGPLLNLLLGFGIPYTLKLAQSGGVMSLKWTTMIGILYGTITTTLVSTLVAMIVMRFHVKRAFGALLVLLYVIYTVVAILIEAKVI